jgi:hypothetical protein
MMTSWGAGGSVILRKNEKFFCNQNRSHSNKMSAPNPFDLYEMHPAPAPTNICPTCGKTFKQLKQHITKSHDKYVVRIVGDRAYMSFNGGPEVEGVAPFEQDVEYEWLWYPGGSETIGVCRTIKTGETSVWRQKHNDAHETKYIHNIKITG